MKNNFLNEIWPNLKAKEVSNILKGLGFKEYYNSHGLLLMHWTLIPAEKHTNLILMFINGSD